MRAAAATPLGTFLLRKLYAPPMPELECEAFGMKFSSPVGIAAGFDTNGNMIDALSASGFGFVEVGSITPRPQSGSAARRLYRLEGDHALIYNSVIESAGVERVIANIKRTRCRTVIGCNIAKNHATDERDAPADFLRSFRSLYQYADYFTVNVCDNSAPEPFMAMWKSASLGAIVRENVQLDERRTADIGVILPLAGNDMVLVPVKGTNGEAAFARVQLVPGSVEPMPLRMTPANVARLGNQMIGQKYGWGGMFGLRDCSAMTRDLMAPFGVWLPRNSQAQARAGERISLQGMNARQKEVTVREKGVPFASLVTMKGHVVLYVGAYRGRPVILHDIWGVRVDEPAGEDNRLILGRVVLTSMTPGKELPTLTDGQTIVERFHTLTVLGGTPR